MAIIGLLLPLTDDEVGHVADLLRNLLLRHPCQKGRLSSWQVPLPCTSSRPLVSKHQNARSTMGVAFWSSEATGQANRGEGDPGEGQRLAAAGNKAPLCRRYVTHQSISLVRRVMQGRTQCRFGCLIFRDARTTHRMLANVIVYLL